jgi:hypothetical protein
MTCVALPLRLTVLIAGCGAVAPPPTGTTSAPPSTSTAALVRPLAVPTFSAPCQRVTGHQMLSAVGLGLGGGPVWPVGFGADGQQTLGQSANGWHLVKVLWAADPSYAGPVLVRGRRIDGDGAVRFSTDGTLSGPEELALDAGTSGKSSGPGPDTRSSSRRAAMRTRSTGRPSATPSCSRSAAKGGGEATAHRVERPGAEPEAMLSLAVAAYRSLIPRPARPSGNPSRT